MADAFIVGAVRTAGGRRNGKLKNWHPIDLGALVLDELVARTGTDPELIEDVIFGCVDQVGAQSANIARNAVLASRLPESVPGTTVDRQCGSSQQAFHFAAQAVMSGVHDVVIAGGVELMSLVPLGGNAIAGHKAGMGSPYGARHEEALPGREVQPVRGRRDDRGALGLLARAARPLRAHEPRTRRARHARGSLRARDRAGRGDARRRQQREVRGRRGHPLRRQPRRAGGAEAALRQGPAHGGHVEPDHRRRRRGAGGERGRARQARRHAARARGRDGARRRRPRDHAHGADPGHREAARARRSPHRSTSTATR